ncbi:putative acid phosphatase 5 [Trichinella pseudospiralis]|uniref:acid phosphatase n=2 Tax=Trichinella pseudospiralis TaxID=6337 RepID=A0A0V0YDC7_TRIPS|nr:putative acid phosphatase 5 [Trichinella pseudospiralis]
MIAAVKCFAIHFIVVVIVFALPSEEALRLVQVVWRHGARASLENTFLNCSHSSEYGAGELSQVGFIEQYELGQFLHERYKNFLSEFKMDEIYVRSTDTNRTILSALVNLAGLFPHISNDSALHLNWQPIPVHSVSKDNDPHFAFYSIVHVAFKLLYTFAKCKKVDDIYWNEVMTSAPVLKLMHEHAELFDMLRKQTGFSLKTLDDIYQVYEPLYSLVNEKKKFFRLIHRINMQIKNDGFLPCLPEWLTVELYEIIEHLYRVSTTFYYNDQRIKPYRGGILLEHIANQIHKKILGSIPKAKYFGYSTHDLTLIGLLENLNVYNAENHPEFSAALMVELHETSTHGYTIELWYRTSLNNNTLKQLFIPECSPTCSAEQFLNFSKDKGVTDWFESCESVLSTTTTSTMQDMNQSDLQTKKNYPRHKRSSSLLSVSKADPQITE